MFMNTAYLNNSQIPMLDRQHPLVITSCGYYQLHKIKKLPTLRPKGRIDLQIIYIASGRAYFYFNDNENYQEVTAGNIVVYKPKDRQKYVYYGVDKTEAYWIHFTGYEAKKLLKQYDFWGEKRVYEVGYNEIYSRVFNKIISEIQRHAFGYQESAVLLFRYLLMQLYRYNLEHQHQAAVPKEIKAACSYFQKNYMHQISIDQYARELHMTPSWFIKLFKKHMEIPPLHYLLRIRMDNARILLENTTYSITEISTLIGYDNALYFSRLFKKYCGQSPAAYRKEWLEKLS